LPSSVKSWVSKWKNAYETAGRLPPAYLFCGPKGSGKSQSAQRIVQTLLGPAQNHPDLVWVIPEKTIKIETIRTVIQRLSLKPVVGERLVVVIQEAEMMTEAAANALLKTLEEPPRCVLFILLSTAPERLPATIRSRCQRVNFQINRETVREELATLLTSWREALTPLFEEIPSSFTRASKLAESIAKGSDEIKPLFELLKSLWHDMTVWKMTRSQETILLPEALPWIENFSQHKEVASLFEEMDLILETERAIEGNVNKTMALERLFVKLGAVL